MTLVQKIIAWSYSRLRDWETCPYKAKLKHVDKLKEPGNAAMDRGTTIHKLAEDYTVDKLKTLPSELHKFRKEFRKLKAVKGVFVEEQLAFTIGWKQVDWFDRNAWVRIKMDARTPTDKKGVMRLVDHKTGKVNEDHVDQLELYAIVGFLLDEECLVVEAELWYLDAGGPPVIHIFKREKFEELKKKWLKRVKPMLVDTRFVPKPNYGCRWCHFNKNTVGYKGEAKPKGPCRFG